MCSPTSKNSVSPWSPCCTAAVSSTAQLWDTAHPGEKIAGDYIMKDRLVVCMHKRAKLRSCSQFWNDFWLLRFSSAPTLLPTERPYFPPTLHYSVPQLPLYFPSLLIYRMIMFLSLFLSLAPVLILSVYMTLTLCSYFLLLFEQIVHCLRLLSSHKYNSPLPTLSSCLTPASLKLYHKILSDVQKTSGFNFLSRHRGELFEKSWLDMIWNNWANIIYT